MTETLGWCASAVLVVTIFAQLARQWRTGQSTGVSRWLYVGQATASAMFLVYSWLVDNTVFVATNGLMAAAALAGLALTFYHRQQAPLAAAHPGTGR